MANRRAPLELLRVEVGDADPACLALLHEVDHRRPGVLEGDAGRPVRPVELVQVDPLDSEAAKAPLALLADRLRPQVVFDDPVRPSLPAPAALREHEDVVAHAERSQRPPDNLFRMPQPVHRGRVHPIHALVDRATDCCDRVVVVDLAPSEAPRSADRPGAESDGRELWPVSPSCRVFTSAPDLRRQGSRARTALGSSRGGAGPWRWRQPRRPRVPRVETRSLRPRSASSRSPRVDAPRWCRARRCRTPRVRAGRSRWLGRPRQTGRERRRRSSSSRSGRTGRGRSARGFARSSPRPGPNSDGSTCTGCRRARSPARIGALRTTSPSHRGPAAVPGAPRRRQVLRSEGPMGEDEARDGLAREVHESPCAGRDRRFEHVERNHDVVAEDDVRRVVDRLRIAAVCATASHRAQAQTRACIGEIGLPVVLRVSGSARSQVGSARSFARTSYPAPISRLQSARPTFPRAPVTRILIPQRY